MLASIAAVQPLFLGLVLAWAGGYKLRGRAVGAAAARSALTDLVGIRHAGTAYRAVGGVELAVAVLLLAPATAGWSGWPAAVLATGFLAYLGYARRVAPESSCGCMSDDATPVSGRSMARAGLLIVAALAATLTDVSWLASLAASPATGGVVLLTEAALLLALSPDLDRNRRRLVGRIRELLLPHPLGNLAEASSGAAAVAQLYRSPIYCANSALLISDVQDVWDAGDWTVLSYAGMLGKPVTVVFAVPKQYDPDKVRMSIVDATDSAAPVTTAAGRSTD